MPTEECIICGMPPFDDGKYCEHCMDNGQDYSDVPPMEMWY